MAIFSDYTGNTMLNNALQTIEAMAEAAHVSQITPELLLDEFKKRDLSTLYARMKNYTIIFTRNGPLRNDKKFGEQIYGKLMEKILANYEDEGDNQCEISGLRYHTLFPELYSEVLRELDIDPKTRDTSINRAWWPLIGALGSDAQALPGAKFAVQIHPICLAIVQFLPLAAVLYRGKVLLVESVNFEYAKSLVRKNYNLVQEMIANVSWKAQIENKKFSKPNYLSTALETYQRLSNRFHDYKDTDLNFWMFSNSGTGAACEIDRIPNSLFRKLYTLYSRNSVELQNILHGKGGFTLVDCLDANKDYWGLYPAKNWNGVSVGFFEDFHKLIQNERLLNLAGYIAGLIDKYKTGTDEKLLKKTDAYNDKNYRGLIFSILIQAAQKNEWNLLLHSQILDDPNTIPVYSGTFSVLKMVHFYFQKQEFKSMPQELNTQALPALQVCCFFIDRIESDGLKTKIIRSLTDQHNYLRTNLDGVIVRSGDHTNFEEIYAILYDEGTRSHFGLLTLLRLYYSSQAKVKLPKYKFTDSIPAKLTTRQLRFLNKYRDFAEQYIRYYTARYGKDEIAFPAKKFRDHVLKSFPKNNSAFSYWLTEIEKNFKETLEDEAETFDMEALLYDENGNHNLSFARFAIEFFLNKLASQRRNETQIERSLV